MQSRQNRFCAVAFLNFDCCRIQRALYDPQGTDSRPSSQCSPWILSGINIWGVALFISPLFTTATPSAASRMQFACNYFVSRKIDPCPARVIDPHPFGPVIAFKKSAE